MQEQMFDHERLQVYGSALDFVTRVAGWTADWDKRHAVADQLGRAAESILSNLADAARQRGAPGRLRIADYAIGSSLECAACLDVAQIKGLLSTQEMVEEKSRLCVVTRMLICLRKAWADSAVCEDAPMYQGEDSVSRKGFKFHHEDLVVYQASLEFMRWFVAQAGGEALSKRLFRQIDEAATSVVLTIAEGNGRYAELDHLRFLQIAQGGAVRAAVYVDLCVKTGVWKREEGSTGKRHLHRVGALLAGF